MLGTAKELYKETARYRDALREIFPHPITRQTPRIVICGNFNRGAAVEDVYPKPRIYDVFTHTRLEKKARRQSGNISSAKYNFDLNTIFINSQLLDLALKLQLVLGHEATHSMALVKEDKVEVTTDELSKYKYGFQDCFMEGQFGLELASYLNENFPTSRKFFLDMDEYVVTFGVAHLHGSNYLTDVPKWSNFWKNLEGYTRKGKVAYIDLKLLHLPQNAASMLIGAYGGRITDVIKDHREMFELDGATMWSRYCEKLLLYGKI